MTRPRRILADSAAVVHVAAAAAGFVLVVRGDLVRYPTFPLLFAGLFVLIGLGASALGRTPIGHYRTGLYAVGTALAVATIPTQNRLLRIDRTEQAQRSRAAMVGQPAPSLRIEYRHALTEDDAKRLSAGSAVGDARLLGLDFCAPWSERCQQHAQVLEAFHRAHAADVLLVMVTQHYRTDVDYRTDVATEVTGLAEFATMFSLSFPMVIVDRATELAYRIQSLPTLVIVDQTGTVIDYAVGVEPAEASLFALEVQRTGRRGLTHADR